LYTRLEPTPEEALTVLHYEDRLLALTENIRHRQKRKTIKNTLAYYGTQLITVVKCFVVQTLE
jgi:hypothetical protein